METVNYLEYFARFYDLIYEKIRSGIDTEFFQRKISGANGKILEVGVGTGRFFIDAINNGADIYGIDISKSMINVLKSKLDKKYHNRVFVQDLVKLDVNYKFDLIIAPFRVLSHLINVGDQLTALNRIYDHLLEDGIFIFDLFVPNLDIIKNGLNEHTDFEGEYEKGKKVRRITSAKSKLVDQIINITFKFVWDTDKGEISKTWKLPFRFFFRYEIEHLVKLSKLKLVEIFGDYNENKLNSESKEFIVVCRK